jgi:hypothetical protein
MTNMKKQKQKEFRLPRKIKKRIGKRFYFYPQDLVMKTYLVAWPRHDQQDYDAWRRGELLDLKKEIQRRHGKA